MRSGRMGAVRAPGPRSCRVADLSDRIYGRVRVTQRPGNVLSGVELPRLAERPAPMSWVISPSIKNDYPNQALGTSVNYGLAEPIEFTQFVLPP